MTDKFSLPGFDGESAFSGAIRFCDNGKKDWEQEWGDFYGSLKPSFRLFATDVFGTAYGLLSNNEVAIFWPETAELESLGIGISEFYEMILADPISTINLDLYMSAVKKYRKPTLDEHFAFKIETALGGELTVENVVIMNSTEHFRSLAKLAIRIKDMPVGAKITSIQLEQ